MRSTRSIAILLPLLLAGPACTAEPESHEIRLVLQITVDGLRADLVGRFETGEGGLRYLLDYQVHRLVHPVDVAPTLAALLGLHRPAGATGTILTEVVEP